MRPLQQQSSSSTSRNLVGYYIASIVRRATRWHQQQQTHSPSNKRKRTLLIYSHRLFNSSPSPLCGSWITHCRPAGSRRRGLGTPADNECHQLFNAGYTLAKIGARDPGRLLSGSTDSMGKPGTRIFWSWWTDGGCIFACFLSLYGHLAIFRDKCFFLLNNSFCFGLRHYSCYSLE